jgi:hypothetical protein
VTAVPPACHQPGSYVNARPFTYLHTRRRGPPAGVRVRACRVSPARPRRRDSNPGPVRRDGTKFFRILLQLFVVNSGHTRRMQSAVCFCGRMICLCTLLMISAIPSYSTLAFTIQRSPISSWSASLKLERGTHNFGTNSFSCRRGITSPMLKASSLFGHYAATDRHLEWNKRNLCLSKLQMSDQNDKPNYGLSSPKIPDIPTGPDAFYSPMEVKP